MRFSVDVKKHDPGGYIVKPAGYLNAVSHIEFEETKTPYLRERPFFTSMEAVEEYLKMIQKKNMETDT